MPVVMITGGKGAIGSWVCRGLVGYCILDISRARKELGYSPQYNLGDGVKHYIEIMKRLKIEPK